MFAGSVQGPHEPLSDCSARKKQASPEQSGGDIYCAHQARTVRTERVCENDRIVQLEVIVMCECECAILWLDDVDAIVVSVSLLGELKLTSSTLTCDFSGLVVKGLVKYRSV